MNNKLKIKITCRHPKEFLNEIIRNKINLYNINIHKKYLEVIIDKDKLSNINKIKLIHKLKIIDYYGISKIEYLLKKYKVLLLFAFAGILINIILSNIIFNVEVETSNKKLESIILKDLEKQGIKKYHLKKTYRKIKHTKEYILSKENDKIEWLEIESHGTKYIIKVEERKLNEKELACPERNIIAKKNAVITKITSSSGEIVKKINDYVDKGEVLISGLIYNKEEVVSKKCAIGIAYGEIWYKVNLEIPKKYYEETLTNKHSYGITIKLLNKELNFNHKFISFKKNEYNIVESKMLPLSISLTKYTKTNIKRKNYNLNNIDSFAEKVSINKLINKNKTPVNVISKKVLKKELNNSKIKVEVFIALEEDITDYQDISSLSIEKLNEENKKRSD